MIYFQINQIKNRKISKRFKSKSKSNKNDLNRDLNHARFKSPMILTALVKGKYKNLLRVTVHSMSDELRLLFLFFKFLTFL
jgi:hypothetical protein